MNFEQTELSEDDLRHLDTVRAAIEREGLLLVQDPILPSVATLVAGETISGSWWGHPAGHSIFRVISAIEDDPDVARFKLVDKKVCLVQRPLWSALYFIGRAKEDWQMNGLSSFASALLARVEEGGPVKETGPHVKELEHRLLCVGDQKHVESGNHATELTSWDRFAKEHRISKRKRALAKCKAEIEAIVDGWAERYGRTAKLPWR
ncbi:MAG: hypothetical protein AB7S26_27940 [Sandaracinaceae bacterium]